MQSDDYDLICEFVVESRDMLDDAEQRLLDLHKTSADGQLDEEAINAIFRQFHSIKGSAGFFQLKHISRVTHEAETLLDLFRKGKAICQREDVDLLCAAADTLRKLFTAIEQQEPPETLDAETDDMVNQLQTAITAITQGTERKMKNTPPPSAPTPLAETASATPAEDQKAPESAIAELPAPPAELVTPDMIKLFIQDATEQLEQAEHALLEFSKEAEPSDEQLNEIFRAMHTFKGNSGFLGFADMQALSHKSESILNLVRDKVVPMNDVNVQILLNVVDILKTAVDRLEREGSADIQGCEVMLQVLTEMAPEDLAAEAAPPPAPLPSASASPTPAPAVAPKTKPAAKAPAPPPPPKQTAAAAAVASGPQVAKQNIRVDVDKLDLLNNLIGELVIAESMVTNNSDLDNVRLDNFDRAAHHLHNITAALQDIAMSLRMVPLAATLRKMIRLVHDLAGKSGKKLELRLVGEETEVDKTVVELIADPLVHLVRNAADHGVEPTEERLAAGKPETGRITIEARHQSGEVWVIISDDGRGLNRDKVLAKAIDRGLVQGNGENMTDEEIYSLIMEPGFSTAEAITDVSGRGVGMDVVKKNLDKLRGRIVIDTKLGRGTNFTMRIPLTLAIIQGMLVRVAKERYVLPMLTIRESFRPTPDIIHTVTGRGEVVSIRGELVPLFRVNRLFAVPDAVTDATQAIVVVVEDGSSRMAFLVDELLGQQEIVIKSLGDVLGHVPGVSGACILPDGQVGLIMDVRGMIRMATARG